MTTACGLIEVHSTDPEVFQDMDNFELNDARKYALSIRFQFPKFSKGFTADDFTAFIQAHIGDENLVSLGRLSFPNEWQMQVLCPEVREKVIRMGRTKINSRTCWISPLSPNEVRGFFHWIPNAVPNTMLEELLKDYGEITLMETQVLEKWNNKVESDTRYFALYLKPGQTADDIPHFIRINDRLGLITVKGRQPACFHCREVGHRKSECKKYREKLSDHCMKKPGEGKPRKKPRGKRYKPNVVIAEEGKENLTAAAAAKPKKKSKKSKSVQVTDVDAAKIDTDKVKIPAASSSKTIAALKTASSGSGTGLVKQVESSSVTPNPPAAPSMTATLEEIQSNITKAFAETASNVTRQLEMVLKAQTCSSTALPIAEAVPATLVGDLAVQTSDKKKKKKKKKNKKKSDASGKGEASGAF